MPVLRVVHVLRSIDGVAFVCYHVITIHKGINLPAKAHIPVAPEWAFCLSKTMQRYKKTASYAVDWMPLIVSRS